MSALRVHDVLLMDLQQQNCSACVNKHLCDTKYFLNIYQIRKQNAWTFVHYHWSLSPSCWDDHLSIKIYFLICIQ